MKFSPGKREQQLVVFVGGLSILILWVYVTFLLRPLLNQAGMLSARVRTAREQVNMLERVVANDSLIRQQHRELQQMVATLRGTLPPEEELPSVIEVLSDLASKSQVKIQTIFPQRTFGDVKGDTSKSTSEAGRTAFVTVPIEIDALAGYHELGVFLNLIEGSNSPPVEVASLRLSANPRDLRRHNMKIIVIAYFSTGGEGARRSPG